MIKKILIVAKEKKLRYVKIRMTDFSQQLSKLEDSKAKPLKH